MFPQPNTKESQIVYSGSQLSLADSAHFSNYHVSARNVKVTMSSRQVDLFRLMFQHSFSLVLSQCWAVTQHLSSESQLLIGSFGGHLSFFSIAVR